MCQNLKIISALQALFSLTKKDGGRPLPPLPTPISRLDLPLMAVWYSMSRGNVWGEGESLG